MIVTGDPSVGIATGLLSISVAVLPWIAAWVAWGLFRDPGYARKPIERALPGWSKTSESFLDPVSGQAIDVWTDITGAHRAYVQATHTAPKGR